MKNLPFILLIFCALLSITGCNMSSQKGDEKCYVSNGVNYEYCDCSDSLQPKRKGRVRLVSPEIAFVIDNVGKTPVTRIIPDINTRFFTNDGDPLVWYYQNDQGQYEFFNLPGAHPQLHDTLNPMDKSTAQNTLDILRSGKTNMIITNDGPPPPPPPFPDYIANHSLKNTPQTKEIIILFIDQDNNTEQNISDALGKIYKSQGFIVANSFFKNEFISDGIFNQLFEGETDLQKKMGLKQHADAICLGKLNISYRTNSKNLTIADAQVNIKITSTGNDVTDKSYSETTTGTGVSEADAKSGAIANLLSLLENKLKSDD